MKSAGVPAGKCCSSSILWQRLIQARVQAATMVRDSSNECQPVVDKDNTPSIAFLQWRKDVVNQCLEFGLLAPKPVCFITDGLWLALRRGTGGDRVGRRWGLEVVGGGNLLYLKLRVHCQHQIGATDLDTF